MPGGNGDYGWEAALVEGIEGGEGEGGDTVLGEVGGVTMGWLWKGYAVAVGTKCVRFIYKSLFFILHRGTQRTRQESTSHTHLCIDRKGRFLVLSLQDECTPGQSQSIYLQ